MDKARENTLTSGMGVFSFNNSAHSQFRDILYNAAIRWADISVPGTRADIVGRTPGLLQTLKVIGLHRVTFGVEGVSDRIRNGYLNKNLTEDDILGACAEAFRANLVEIKLYLISTGREEERDFKEFLDLLQRVLDLRADIGVRTSIRVVVSPLHYYWGTPLQWESREAAIDLLMGKKTFSPGR